MKKLIFLLPVLSLLCGCYPYTEVENMDILTSVYAGEAVEGILLGGGVANVRSFSDSMAEQPVSLIRAQGDTLETAVRNLQQSADHALFFGALRAVIFEENLAQSDISRFLHYLDAQPRLRRSTAVFVTDGDLETIVQYKAINDFSAGFSADSIMTTLYEEKQMRYMSIGDVMYALSYGDAGYAIPHITVEKGVMRVDGYSLFNGGKMVGYTDNPAVLFFVLDGARGRYLHGGTALTVTLERRRIVPQVQHDQLHVDAEFAFSVQADSGVHTDDAQVQALAENLQAQLQAVLDLSKTLGCDYPELYKTRMAQSRADFDMEKWNALLPDMTYTVSVTAEAR